MSTLLDRARAADQRYYGVQIGLVTDNADGAGLGRVKLRFPWFSKDMESEWCRVAQPYAGNGYGHYWVPEVGDEVLVAFVQGDMRFPIVVGGLYNGVDTPPFARNGEDPKYIQTKAGHRILFEDSDGKQKIEIVDAKGVNSIVIDTAADSISITATGDISVDASGTLRLSGSRGVEIVSDGNVTVRGVTIMLN